MYRKKVTIKPISEEIGKIDIENIDISKVAINKTVPNLLDTVSDISVTVNLDYLKAAAKDNTLTLTVNGKTLKREESRNMLKYLGKDGEWKFLYEEDNACMDFSKCLEKLKKGCKAARKGWNGKGMFVKYVSSKSIDLHDIKLVVAPVEPFFTIKNVNNKYAMWVPSIGDLLAEDWYIVE